MNKKGFTLVELLATIVILSLVMGISIVGILTSLENAKKKTEEEFLNQISVSVDNYIAMCFGGLYSSSDNCKTIINFSENVNKYIDRECESHNLTFDCASLNIDIITTKNKRDGTVNVYGSGEMNDFDGILGENIITQDDLMNPVNNKSCKNGSIISFYIDEDHVNYYEISLPNDCIKYSHEKWPISSDGKYFNLNTLHMNSNDTVKPTGSVSSSTNTVAGKTKGDSKVNDTLVELDDSEVVEKK